MARFDSKRKLERNRALIEYSTAHPELTLKQIGEAFSITRQRVWKIIRAHEKKTGRSGG